MLKSVSEGLMMTIYVSRVQVIPRNKQHMREAGHMDTLRMDMVMSEVWEPYAGRDTCFGG